MQMILSIKFHLFMDRYIILLSLSMKKAFFMDKDNIKCTERDANISF